MNGEKHIMHIIVEKQWHNQVLNLKSLNHFPTLINFIFCMESDGDSIPKSPKLSLSLTVPLTSRTGSIPCDHEEWGGPRSGPSSAPVRGLCLYQASSTGGRCNLVRFGSPEPGLLTSSYKVCPTKEKWPLTHFSKPACWAHFIFIHVYTSKIYLCPSLTTAFI